MRDPATHIHQHVAPRTYLREWAAFRHLEQKQIAERMGCEPTLSKLLTGKMKLTVEWMAAYSAALGIEVVDLFRDPEAPTSNDLLRNLTPEKRAEVVRVVRVMTGTDN